MQSARLSTGMRSEASCCRRARQHAAVANKGLSAPARPLSAPVISPTRWSRRQFLAADAAPSFARRRHGLAVAALPALALGPLRASCREDVLAQLTASAVLLRRSEDMPLGALAGLTMHRVFVLWVVSVSAAKFRPVVAVLSMRCTSDQHLFGSSARNTCRPASSAVALAAIRARLAIACQGISVVCSAACSMAFASLSAMCRHAILEAVFRRSGGPACARRFLCAVVFPTSSALHAVGLCAWPGVLAEAQQLVSDPEPQWGAVGPLRDRSAVAQVALAGGPS